MSDLTLSDLMDAIEGAPRADSALRNGYGQLIRWDMLEALTSSGAPRSEQATHCVVIHWPFARRAR